LALQLGNKAAINAFLAQYPEGYYANLAKLQLAQIAAEETRIAATAKAQLAEQQRTRLVTEGARIADQEKAAADVKAAEEARIAAEKTKQAAQEQAAEAERKRNASEISEAGMSSGNKLAVENAAPDSPAAGPSAQNEKGVKLAALSTGSPQADLVKSVQSELSRVGCFTGAVDGEWNAASQRSLALFNRHTGTKLAVASLDALDAIKLKPSRVCPLICKHGYRADGDSCTKITCGAGSFLNNDNECEKRREKKPVAKRDRPESQAPEARQAPEPRRVVVRRSQIPTGPGLGSRGQPLTGVEREKGCNSYQAIMSGVCP